MSTVLMDCHRGFKGQKQLKTSQNMWMNFYSTHFSLFLEGHYFY